MKERLDLKSITVYVYHQHMNASIIIAAAQLAARYHKDHTRKNNNRPYQTHLIRTAGRVATLPGVKDADVAAAFLHDSLEDIPQTLEAFERMSFEILETCGQDTLDLVLALTNPSKRSKLTRPERKRMDREHLAKCARRVKRIKLVDRIDNLEESILDLTLHNDRNYTFNEQYAAESELLLNEALRGADPELELELERCIQTLRWTCRSQKLGELKPDLRDTKRPLL